MTRRVALIYPLLMAVLAFSPVSAQVNIESMRRGEDQPGFSGSLGFDLSARSGNVELVELGLRGRLDYVSGAFTTLLVANGDLGWEGGEQFSNEGLVHLREVYRLRSWLRPEAFVQVNYDESRLLDFRGLVGGGLRIALYENGKVRLWWVSTYMFEHERLDLGSGAVHPRRTSVHRWSNYLTSKVDFNERTTLAATVYVQPRFDDLEDARILSEVRLGVEVSPPFSLLVGVRLHYDSLPPDGTDRLDMTVRSGVAVEF